MINVRGAIGYCEGYLHDEGFSGRVVCRTPSQYTIFSYYNWIQLKSNCIFARFDEVLLLNLGQPITALVGNFCTLASFRAGAATLFVSCNFQGNTCYSEARHPRRPPGGNPKNNE